MATTRGLNAVHCALNGTVSSQDVAMRLVQQLFPDIGRGIKQVSGKSLVSCFDPKSAMDIGSEVWFKLLHGMAAVGR